MTKIRIGLRGGVGLAMALLATAAAAQIRMPTAAQINVPAPGKLRVLPPPPPILKIYTDPPPSAIINLVLKPDTSDWYVQGYKMGWPAVVALGPDRMGIGLFARASDGSLMWRQTGDIGVAWTNTGAKVDSNPSCISSWTGADVIDCFWRGSDGGLHAVTLNNGKAGVAEDLGGQIQGTPSAVRIGSATAILVRGSNNQLWAMRGGPRTIAGGGIPWTAWEQVGGTGDHTLLNNPGCGYRDIAVLGAGGASSSDPTNVLCFLPMSGGLGEVHPFIGVGTSSNHLMTVLPYDSSMTPSYAPTGVFANGSYNTSTSIIAYVAPSGALMVATNLSVNNKTPGWTNLGGKASSAPSCALIGPSSKTAKFACAVQRSDGNIWVREFNLAG